MEDAFFAWVAANDVPFFAVFAAMIGMAFAAMFAFAAGVNLAVSIYRKLKSN